MYRVEMGSSSSHERFDPNHKKLNINNMNSSQNMYNKSNPPQNMSNNPNLPQNVPKKLNKLQKIIENVTHIEKQLNELKIGSESDNILKRKYDDIVKDAQNERDNINKLQSGGKLDEKSLNEAYYKISFYRWIFYLKNVEVDENKDNRACNDHPVCPSNSNAEIITTELIGNISDIRTQISILNDMFGKSFFTRKLLFKYPMDKEKIKEFNACSKRINNIGATLDRNRIKLHTILKYKGGYRPTKRNRTYYRLWKKGKPIGFTMTSSLKAKGLIPRSNGTRRVSKKYR